ncbi:MAG: hypothetical protein WC314_26930 [Vulcanimicrobiota bacterium]
MRTGIDGTNVKFREMSKSKLGVLLLAVILAVMLITHSTLQKPDVLVDEVFFLGQSHSACHVELNLRSYRDPEPPVKTGVNEVAYAREDKETGVQSQLRIRYSDSGNVEFFSGSYLALSYGSSVIYPNKSGMSDVELILGKPTRKMGQKNGKAFLDYSLVKLSLEFLDDRFVGFSLGDPLS